MSDYSLHRMVAPAGVIHWARSTGWRTLCGYGPATIPAGWLPGAAVDCADCLDRVQRLDPAPFAPMGPLVNLLALGGS